MLLSIPPKYAVSEVAGLIKGKSATHLARTWGGHKQSLAGRHFCAAILFRPWGAAGRRSASLSATRKWKTSGWTH